MASAWHNTRPLDYTQLGDLIERERIDILVDLSGHTADNRLPTLASRPAPIQITYLGYPNTTGLPPDVVQYRLTDSVCDPLGVADELHTEALVRLPGCFLCYKAPADAPAVAQPPAHKNGYITFGCFNAAPKCSPALMAWWAEILLRVPESRLVLKNTAMDDPQIGRDIRDRFGALGVKAERLILLGPQRSVVEHLGEYARVDVALDTYPYNGTTTTCESLWMGVPVVTLAGRSHRSRVGASVLGSVGLHRLIGESPRQYVEAATELASEAETRAVLRRTLRRSMSASGLMDDRTFVRNLESAYRAAWREHCREEVL